MILMMKKKKKILPADYTYLSSVIETKESSEEFPRNIKTRKENKMKDEDAKSKGLV